MKAVITGASSGIGREIARELSRKGYDIIAVARRQDKLKVVKEELNTNVSILPLDLSTTEGCLELYNAVKDEDIDVLVNNAGFGVIGKFTETSLERELEMVDINIKALHTLTKLFLEKFTARNRGYILNVASVGGFMPGPLMAGYFASKAYVVSFTDAVCEELRASKSKVYVGSLCPGPVSTEFWGVAGGRAGNFAITARKAARHAVKQMLKGKTLIIPTLTMKCSYFLSKFAPRKMLTKTMMKIQNRFKKTDK